MSLTISGVAGISAMPWLAAALLSARATFAVSRFKAVRQVALRMLMTALADSPTPAR